ncbi:MAG TPA: alpha/beta hydrolase [Egibacteraceae bacterium]|nr:alpha/beta hydrolase [Egibacteraceae bacterium]
MNRRRQGARLAAVAGTAAAGAAIAWAASRPDRGPLHVRDPEWAELHRDLGAQALSVASFDGTRLHADVLGPPGAPVIVLAHGYVLSARAWHYQVRDLAGEFRVVAYDQRGHGRSQTAASGDYSIQALGRDLAAVLDAAAPDGVPAVVAGHSMGGMSVLSFAEQFPDAVPARLAGAVLLSTTAADVVRGSVFSAGSALVATVLGAAAAKAVGLRPPQRVHDHDVALFLTRLIGLAPSASPAHVAFTQQLALSCPKEVSASVLPALTALDVREAAGRLGVPTLVMVGAADRITPPGAARELVSLLPSGELVVLPGVGHMAPLEAHRDVTAHLRAFARRCLERPAA